MDREKRQLTREEEEWCSAFEKELEEMVDAGVSISLDGRKEPLRMIAEACMVRDNGPYTCHYAAGTEGLELCFLRERVSDLQVERKEEKPHSWFGRLLGRGQD